ncbi:microcin C transport system substrate-binding protein [Angulomicrobium amanitiforme]|uniref:Microcin C transport system substrate-binding protein n=2 Tax=Ancylobacter amanitiformis TaxID=217069 RepID=A0ABU0LWG0_9HYPH|nr:extracellular solute-binding protein [Ancylobacter amanitiformis]MDQ0513071.1 microcin C transport system substrate-binding protein [Ancylobacter amanitiformis]
MSAPLSRRAILTLAAGAGAGAMLVRPRGAFAQSSPPAPAAAPASPIPGGEVHGLSAFGDLKYPADFKHFDYVDPEAAKGGSFSQVGSTAAFNQSFQTFNSLNGYILKGDGAQGIDLIFDSLMVRAFDEPDAVYGLVARSVSISPDGTVYRFRLRPEARFHDGTKLTAEDVAFSLNVLKEKGHPVIGQNLRQMEGAEAEGEEVAVVTFSPGRARDVPLFAASLPIFSRAYYSVKSFEDSSLDPPLGSGPYKVGRFEPGRYIAYERVADYWGAGLPVNAGVNNFDTLRYEYFRDREVGFEAFKARAYLFRQEFTARTWATGYDFPALREGKVKQAVLPDKTPSGAQGWFLNLRRPQFADPRMREALSYAFDFEWTNKNLMFDLYRRTTSFFENSDLKAEGPAGPQEIALMERLGDKLSAADIAALTGEPWTPPVSDGSGQDRTLLRKATHLLREAGWVIKDGRLVDPQGQALTIEFLDDENGLERHTAPFIKNLKLLGIEAHFRLVDSPQYQRRLNDFDFDATVRRFSVSTVPGESLRNYFGSRAAATPGSNNLSGIQDPVVDLLIEQVILADTRDKLRTACHVLDRRLRAGRYWVPHWYSAEFRIAFWDEFGWPSVPRPAYDRAIPGIWSARQKSAG